MSQMLATPTKKGILAEYVTPPKRISFLFPKRSLAMVLALGLLPWLGVISFTAGSFAAIHFVCYAILIFAIGYSAVSLFLPVSRRPEMIVFAPALGILTISALSALWLRLGLSIVWIPALWLVFFLPGAWNLWVDRALWGKTTIAYPSTLILLSTLICLVFFLPSARRDAVLQHDGSFNWMYTDTQQFHAVAASINGATSPPRNPGTVTVELFYHFGPYVPAAAMSRFTGLGLGDAVARVTRAASLWALVFSVFGAGTLLSLKATGLRFGGPATVFGLFFYGALLALFTDEGGSSSRIGGAILFTIPAIRVICDGGPFSHLILGHSVLHGMSAITAIMGLCLVQCERRVHLSGRDLLLLALPSFVVPVNSFAALYCLGLVFILLFWTRLAALRSWLWTAVMFILFASTWALMGYTRAPDAGGAALKANLGSQWWTIAVWLSVGLGFRIFAFRWVSRPWRNPLAALVLATFLFLFSFSTLLHLKDDNERYGLYFLQCMFSIFAFSRLTPTWWRSFDRSELIMDWLRLAKNAALLLSAFGVLIGISILFTHQHTGIPSFRLRVLLCFLMALAMAGLLSLMTQKRAIARSSSAILTAVLLVGFSAWMTPWIDFGLGRKKMDVSLTSGEVRGLQRLHDLSRRDDRFATNKHAVETIPIRNQRSYGYTAFSERPVLLEGYLSRGETYYAWFSTLLQNNDLIFTTTNPETVHTIARTYNVHWLVARPGTDIALPRPLPFWLVEQQNCGDLRIYRVD